jgi:hypothetical protein
MREHGSSDRYVHYLDVVPAVTLAGLNVLSLFGLRHCLLGAPEAGIEARRPLRSSVTPKKKLSDRADHDDLFGALSTVDQSTGLEKCCARRKYTPEWYFGPISDLNAQSPFFQHGLGLLNSAEHGLRDQQDPRLCEH